MVVTTAFYDCHYCILWSPPVNLKLCCTSSMIDATVHNFWMCVYTNFCRGCLITCQYSYVLCLVLCVYDPYRYFLWHVYSINCNLWPFYALYPCLLWSARQCDLYGSIRSKVQILWANYIQNLNSPIPLVVILRFYTCFYASAHMFLWPCIEHEMICIIASFYDLPSMTFIAAFYNMLLWFLWAN